MYESLIDPMYKILPVGKQFVSEILCKETTVGTITTFQTSIVIKKTKLITKISHSSHSGLCCRKGKTFNHTQKKIALLHLPQTPSHPKKDGTLVASFPLAFCHMINSLLYHSEREKQIFPAIKVSI
jgi:hypothetical protein